MTGGLISRKKNIGDSKSGGIPLEAQCQYRQASALIFQGKTEDALDCLKQAIEISPNYTEALHETGSCLQILGRHDEASVYYARALQEIGDRLCEIGRYEESQGRYWAAINRYEVASKYYRPEFSPCPVEKSPDYGKKLDDTFVSQTDPVDP